MGLELGIGIGLGMEGCEISVNFCQFMEIKEEEGEGGREGGWNRMTKKEKTSGERERERKMKGKIERLRVNKRESKYDGE